MLSLAVLALVVGGACCRAQTPAPPAPDAGAVLAAAREALGGEKKLAAVKTLVGHRAHAPGARRQPRADRVRDLRSSCRTNTCARTRCPRRRAGRRRPVSTATNLIQLPPQAAPPPAGGRRAAAADTGTAGRRAAGAGRRRRSRTSRGSMLGLFAGIVRQLSAHIHATSVKPRRRKGWPTCSKSKVRPTSRCGCSSIGTRTCR